MDFEFDPLKATLLADNTTHTADLLCLVGYIQILTITKTEASALIPAKVRKKADLQD